MADPKLLADPAGRQAARRIPIINYVKDMYPEAAFAGGIVPENGFVSVVLLWLDRLVAKACDRNVVISNRMKDSFVGSRGVTPEKVNVVWDWLDLDQIKPCQGENGWRSWIGDPEDKFVCMFAGTMGYASGG